MVDATGIRGLDDDTGEENWAVQLEIFEGSDTATISGVGRFILLQVAGKQQVLFLDAEDGTVHTIQLNLCSGDLGELRMPCRAESRSVATPSGRVIIPRVLWKLEEEQRLIQWVNGENPVVLVLAGGSEDPSLHVGSFTS